MKKLSMKTAAIGAIAFATGMQLAVAQAQEEQAIEEIVVYATPFADAERAAQEIQRESKIPINVVSADGIGRFPDQNVAASLSRMPGVAVERDQGQERLVSIRGPNRWTSLAMNGTNVMTSSAGGSAGLRTVRFDTIPSAIVSRIELYKAVSPDMPGETVSGRANIITRSAFDNDGFFASFDAGYGITDLEDNSQYDVKGALSNTFGANGEFGFVFSGSMYSRDQRTNNIENRYLRPCSAEQASGCESRIFGRRAEFRTYDLVRENTSGTVRLEYQPGENHSLFANVIYTEFVDDEDLYRYSVRYDRGSVGVAAGSNTPEGGFAPSARVRPTIFITPRGEENLFYGVGGSHRLANEWNVDWGASAADTSSFDSQRTVYWQLRPVDIAYSYANPDLPTAVITRPGTSTPITQADLNRSSPILIPYLPTENDTEAFDIHLDLEKEIVDGITLKAGARFVDREQLNFRQIVIADLAALAAAGVDASIAQFTTGVPLGGFPRDFQAEAVDYRAIEAFVLRITSDPDFRVVPTTGGDANAVRGYVVDETILAGYVMGTYDAPWGSIVGGLRVERAENTGSANSFVNGAVTPLTFDQSETVLLPSVYLNYDLNEEMKLRFSVSKGIARPDFDTLSGRFVVDDVNSVISGGNSDIDSEDILSIELNYEWYFDDDLGLFSVAVFHKNISDPFFTESRPFASDILNSAGVDRSGYELTALGNGDSGSLSGVEFGLYKKFPGGFGVQANISFNDGELTTPDGRDVSLLNASDTVGNVSLFYENYNWSARLNYQYRDDWLDALGGTNFDRFWDADTRVSAQVQYEWNEHLTLYFEGNNLTDEEGIRYRGFRNRVYEREAFGRRYMVGFRSTFGR